MKDLNFYKNHFSKKVWRAKVRFNAKQKTESWPQECKECGYSKHVQICHIKQVSSFSIDTPLDIINSDSNLVLLCPNCHWELDHANARTLIKQKETCNCGNRKYRYSSCCRSCAAKKQVKVKNKPSKDELKILIEKEPYSHIAKKYNVSDNTIKDWAIDYNLPIPNRRGYWQKIIKL